MEHVGTWPSPAVSKRLLGIVKGSDHQIMVRVIGQGRVDLAVDLKLLITAGERCISAFSYRGRP